MWTYAQCHGSIHKSRNRLNIKEGFELVKQASRNFRLELEVHIKQKIQKLLDIGFRKPIQHSTWLANIVLVKKDIFDVSLTSATSTKHVKMMSSD